MACYTPLKGYRDIISGGLTFDKSKSHSPLEVACGQCIGCRTDHRIMWTIRIIHEAHLHDGDHGNQWITLTYRDQGTCTDKQHKSGHYIPQDYSLRPSDVSKFIRALRQQNKDHKIRYFYCGEYGELGRPHYHFCLFNHQFKDLQLFKDDEGLYTHTSPTLENLWPHGFSTISDLNYNTAAYTAGYVFAKITGKKARDHYLRCDEYGVAYWLQPEFIRMSTGNKKPPCGLGAGFYEKYKDDIFPSDETPVPGKGTVQLVPRYYTNILKNQDPSSLELVKQLRKTFLENHKQDFTPEALHAKHVCAKARHNLKRNLQ